METLTKVLIGVGVVAAGITAAGLYEHKKASAQAANDASGLTVVLSPGLMTAVGLSLSGDRNFAVSAPAGAKGAVVPLSSDATIVAIQGLTIQAMKAGSATVVIAWTDASGAAQTSTIPVTVAP